MSWTKNYHIRCDMCGAFCNPVDSFVPFGCSDPENPEPYPEEHICINCWPIFLLDMWEAYKRTGRLHGDWQKSRAERAIAKRAGLEWVHSSGFVDLRTELDVLYSYILTSEKMFYEPYLDWHKEHPRHDFWLRESPNCRRCGCDWKTGHTRGTEYCHQYKKLALPAPNKTPGDKNG